MLSKPLLLPALASLAYAESYVTSIIYPQPDSVGNFVASVDGDTATATYVLSCPTDKICLQSGDEGEPKAQTYIVAGDRVTMTAQSDDAGYEPIIECSVDGTKEAECTYGIKGHMETGSLERLVIADVTVTAGTITGASTGSGAAATETSSSDSETSSEAEATPTSTESGDSDAEETGATPTGGVARVTGVVGAVAGGFAAALIGGVL
ncbi:uncharacterized protein BDV14DRAFT_179406 [Aspergillus stella-maris]|uniref:uncharacterized protein n=1 Tax=Aspergillus stella-maris TaxID=1810926 RepID=UPI003CCD6BB3